ncbi:toprim domain-containing protein, partial [Enterococcus hirae]
QDNYGFLFGCECSYKQDVTLYVTESPIESMSLYELTKDSLPDNSWFLSLSGLKEETMWATVNKLQDYLLAPRVQVVLALNNDTRGRECIEKIHQGYLKKKEDSQFDERVKLALFLPDLENGDWNEILELKETGQLASRQEKIKEKHLAQALWTEKISQQMEASV